MSYKEADISEKLVPTNYLQIAKAAQTAKDIAVTELLRKRKIPLNGWPDDLIESMVRDISALDSNNNLNRSAVGEREGRIACSLVARRHYNFGHGIGRSGDLLEPQPKAAGSTILVNLTNALVLDLIHIMGVNSCQFAFIAPLATGMSLTLCMLSFKRLRPCAKYVLWSRIDQKSCFKCITTAGLIPIPIEPIPKDNSNILSTDVQSFEKKLNEVNSDEVLCIMSTTSCFAPRECDSIIELANLAKCFQVPHIVNNAYGLQSFAITHQLEQACQQGRVDIFVQSTDKNLMVPVGGAIIAGTDEDVVRQVAKSYVGRASSSQCLDVLMTILSLGKTGYLYYVKQRKECFLYLAAKLREFAEKHNTITLQAKNNPFSLALAMPSKQTVCSMASVTYMGSMLFTRGISGVRVVDVGDSKLIDGYTFENWGTHSSQLLVSYMTASATVGIAKAEIDKFIRKLEESWVKFFNEKAAE